MTAGKAEIIQRPDQREIRPLAMKNVLQQKHQQGATGCQDGNIYAIGCPSAEE